MFSTHYFNKFALLLTSALVIASCGDDSGDALEKPEEASSSSFQVDLTKAEITLGDEEIVSQAAQGNFRRVRTMIENKSAAINSIDKFGVTPLIAAANNGHEDTVQLLLDYINKGDSRFLDAGDSSGKTALYHAVEFRRPEIVEMLLDHDANPNLYSNAGVFPLHQAVMQGETGMVRLLLEESADANPVNPNVQDLQGKTPLMVALSKGNSKIVDLLLENGASLDVADNDGMTALMYAVRANSKDLVGYLLQKKAKINYMSERGLTALIVALQDANFEMARHLLIKGADPSMYKPSGKSPLEIAVAYEDADIVLVNALLGKLAQTGMELPAGVLKAAIRPKNVEIVKLLIDSGAKVSALEENNNNALLRALEMKAPQVAMLLVQEGAQVNKLNKDGYSGFALAAKNNFLELGAMLLDRGANLEPKTKNAAAIPLSIILKAGNAEFLDLFLSKSDRVSVNKLLIQAVVESKSALVPVAIKYGANPDVSDSLGKPVLWLAVAKGSFENVKHLLNAGAQVNSRDAQKGATPLMIAVAARNAQMASYLLAAKADPNIVDSESLNALSYAILTDQPEMIKLLVQAGADVNARNDRGGNLAFVVENSKLNKARKAEMLLLLRSIGFQG